MWTARAAWRDENGWIVLSRERSALWTDKAALLKEVELSHPGIMPAAIYGREGEWYSYILNGEERFVVIEQVQV